MAELVILDTSVWIEYFRGKNAPLCTHVEALIAERRLRQLHIITAELLRGAAHASEQRVIQSTIGYIPIASLTDQFWLIVGQFCFDLARKGVVVSLPDAWIAKAAIEHHCMLWSLDHHFQPIARHTSLRLFQIAS